MMARWVVSIAIFGFAAILLFPASFIEGRQKPSVTFTSECSCEGNHGVSRWAAKTDLAEPPTNAADIQAITPSQMHDWKGPGGNIPRGGGRMEAEKRWYAVTGRVKKVRAEDDGDLHMILGDADGSNPLEAVVEIPLGARWCALRETVFSWTDATFPFPTARAPFRLVQNPVITAVGKAFFDTDHSGNDTGNNRRKYDKKLAVWEIHPVMKIILGSSTITAAPAQPQPQATAAEVTITQPVTIIIPYGRTVLRPGMTLKVVSRTNDAVVVRYMDGTYSVPISSTDLK
jgi:hypothetical protein